MCVCAPVRSTREIEKGGKLILLGNQTRLAGFAVSTEGRALGVTAKQAKGERTTLELASVSAA